MFTLLGLMCYHWGMELTQDQYERIAPLLPVQRGNVSIRICRCSMPFCTLLSMVANGGGCLLGLVDGTPSTPA